MKPRMSCNTEGQRERTHQRASGADESVAGQYRIRRERHNGRDEGTQVFQ